MLNARTKITAALIALTVALFVVRPIGDPDIGWHIAAGRWAIAHHALPRLDYWNTFAVGKPWVPYSWSSELLISWTEQHFGWEGLIVLSFLFAAFLAGSCFIAYCSLSGSPVIASLLTFVSIAACLDYFDLRPQSLTWGFLALALACAERARNRHSGAAAAFCILCMFWGNTQITTVFGIVAGGIWACSNGRDKTAAKFAAAGIAGSLITPHLGKEWLVMLKKADHPFVYSIITEFQPASVWHPSAAVTLLTLILLGALASEQRGKLPIHLFYLASFFTVLGFAVQKFVPYAGIVCCSVLALYLRIIQTAEGPEVPISQGLGQLFRIIGRVRPAWKLIFVIFVLGAGTIRFGKVIRHPIDRLALPVAAMKFIEGNRLPPPILNDFSDGGYLIYRFLGPDGGPRETVPIDGRTNVNDPRIMNQYVNAVFGNSQWHDYFESVKPGTVIWRNRYALPAILMESGEWCRLYSDATAVSPMRGWSVFVHRGSHGLCPSVHPE